MSRHYKLVYIMAGAAYGGAETAYVDMCIAMRARGHDVLAITRKNDIRVPALLAGGVKVETLPFGGKLDIYTPWRMKQIFKNFKPDIVQTWMVRGARKTPAWSASMGIKKYHKICRLGGYYKAKNFKDADHCTTITPDIRRHLIDHGWAADRVTHINNFAETEKDFMPIARDSKAPLIIALGRLHRAKAFDTLIRAVAATKDVECWIAGEGPDHDDLQRLINDLNMGARIKLLGWRADRAALFDAADICVFPSRYEPFGTVFVQAWANKTPLITTLSDGPRQFVHHEEDGLCLEIDNTDAMTQAIERLIDDKALAKKLVKNGYARYQNEFTVDASLGAYEDLYMRVRQDQAEG